MTLSIIIFMWLDQCLWCDEIYVCDESVCKWLSGRVGAMTVHKLGVHISHSIYIYVYGVGYIWVDQVFFQHVFKMYTLFRIII